MRTAARPPDATAPAAAPSTTAPAVAPTTGTPSPTVTAATSSTFTASTHAGSGGGAAILTSAFGPDYTAQPKSPSGFGGDLTLTPGSPSSAGLPAGYQATITLQVISGTSNSATGPVDTMTALCGALVEKGATMKPCVPQTVNGLSVQRAEVDARTPRSAPGRTHESSTPDPTPRSSTPRSPSGTPHTPTPARSEQPPQPGSTPKTPKPHSPQPPPIN